MRVLVVFIPILSLAIYAGVREYRVRTVINAVVEQQSGSANVQKEVEAASDKGRKPQSGDAFNLVAWLREKVRGAFKKDDPDKGYGFKYGECSKVGVAKQCRIKD